MSYQLGIDLGTTFTAAAVDRGGQVEIVTLGSRAGSVPSVVLVRGQGDYLFGETAQHRGMSEPDRLAREFKRRIGDARPLLLGGTAVSAEELTAAYLHWVVERVTEREGEAPARTVVTHPANWGAHKLEAFEQAIEAAGIGLVELVSEPVAAAVRYASLQRVDEGAIIAVYDLGGGTFDTVILRKHGDGFELIGRPDGVEYLGGVDFDEAVFFYVRSELGEDYVRAEREPGFSGAVAALKRECVSAKEALSFEDEAAVPVLLPGVSRTVKVTRAKLESMIRPSVEESIAALGRCMRGAGLEPPQLDRVLLVGGSSRVPLVGSMLSQLLGRPVGIDTDPKYAVAQGAAIYSPMAMAPTAMVGSEPVIAATPPPPPPPPLAPATTAAAPVPPPGVPFASADTADVAPVAPFTRSGEMPKPPVPKGKQRSKLLPLAVLAGLVLVGGAAAAWWLSRGDDTPTSTATGPARVVGAGTLEPPEVPSAENTVEIGAGTYSVGADDGAEGHAPTQVVEVSPFFIDKFEVTNAAYAGFVDRGGADPPAGWIDAKPAPGTENLPVVGVSFDDAGKFCEAFAKRLPAEAEWEVSARGIDGRLYPWGADPAAVTFPAGLYEVGTVAGTESATGVADLVGNAWEWVDDPYADTGGQAVLRGGDHTGLVDAAHRRIGDGADPALVASAGFRCAADEVDSGVLAIDEAEETTLIAVEGVLISDDFADPASGWPAEQGSNYIRGYHPPDFYHVEARGVNQRVLAPRGVNFANVEVETKVKVDHTDTESGRFRYGLLVRAEGIDYYAFTIDPSSGTWAVVHDDSLGFRELASGNAAMNGPDGLDQLNVRMDGTLLQFSLNGALVHELDTHGYHVKGDLGFFVENFDESLAHVHFDEIVVREL